MADDDGVVRAAKRARSAPAAGEGSSMVARQAAENAKLGRTGGIYVPPFKLAALRQEMADKDKRSAEFQRLSWEALRKGINGLVNKVNMGNIRSIVPELLELNLVRGRGVLCRALMKAQLASPGFTHIYAALVAVLNTKLPENGELLLKRVLVGFRRAYRRRDKVVATGFAKFLAHLCNHQVAHELVALQLLTVLLDDPTDDSVEIAVQFTKEVGQLLDEVSPRGLLAVFERFRGILHEGTIDKRVQYTIEGLFAARKAGFADYPAVPDDLDLVERDDQITFELSLDDKVDREEALDVFKVDDDFEAHEAAWGEIKREILGDEDDDDDADNDDDDALAAAAPAEVGPIQDLTEQDLVNLRRTIYLTIMSSVGFEECAHKLMKLDIRSGLEMELCNMLIECCSQERTYLRYYGLLGQRFCVMTKAWQEAFDKAFEEQYAMIHRLETNKLRNVAKFFAHLLETDALPWTCLEYVRLNEEETTSSSRIFVKILCQELAEHLGLATLRDRFNDQYMSDVFAGLFPRENPRDTRFAINFFTSIGLGGLTDALRKHLKEAPKRIMEQQMAAARAAVGASSSDSDSDSSSDSSSSSGSSSSDSSDSGSSSSSSSSSSPSSSSSSSRGGGVK